MNDIDPYAPPPADEAIASPLTALVARWPLAVALTLLGALVGVGAGAVAPSEYTAEARVAVGYGSLSSGAIAGFPQAAEDLASNYARYVNDVAQLPGGVSTVTASPIPGSNVVRIEGTGMTTATLLKQVKAATDDLITEANRPQDADRPEVILRAFDQAASAAARSDTTVQVLQARLTTAISDSGPASAPAASVRRQLTSANAQAASDHLKESALGARYQAAVTASQSADLVSIRKAQVLSNSRTAHMQRYGLVGLVLGFVVALVLASALARRRSRSSLTEDGSPSRE